MVASEISSGRRGELEDPVHCDFLHFFVDKSTLWEKIEINVTIDKIVIFCISSKSSAPYKDLKFILVLK